MKIYARIQTSFRIHFQLNPFRTALHINKYISLIPSKVSSKREWVHPYRGQQRSTPLHPCQRVEMHVVLTAALRPPSNHKVEHLVVKKWKSMSFIGAALPVDSYHVVWENTKTWRTYYIREPVLWPRTALYCDHELKWKQEQQQLL